MGIKFLCPNGHKLHVKSFLASQRGVCPQCGEKFIVPAQSIPDIRVESLGVKSSKKDAKRVPIVSALPAHWSPGPAADEPAVSRPDPVAAAESGAAPIRQDVAPKSSKQAQPQRSSSAPQVAAAAPADPIDEAPTAVWYVRIASGEQFGPAQGDQMRGWLTEGRVTHDSLVWREGWAEWLAAERVFPQLVRSSAIPAVQPNAISAFEQGLAEQVETLVTPAPSAETRATAALSVDTLPQVTPVIKASGKTKLDNRMVLIVLVVGVICLLPVFIWVLFR